MASGLSQSDKVRIASDFIQHSPPGQTQKVIEDVQVLLGKGALDSRTLSGIVERANRDSFLCVCVPPSGERVLLTPEGELSDGHFLDPTGKQQLVIDHVSQQCTGVKALPSKLRAACAAADGPRESVDAAMREYAAETLPEAVVTTYGKKTDGNLLRVTSCVSTCKMSLSNYWAGLWRSTWTLEMSVGGSTGRLSGKVACNVHYFEDGNVQLLDSTTFEADVSLGDDIGKAFQRAVAEQERAFIAAMEEVFLTMSETVLNALRRRLPITKTKFDWENAAGMSGRNNLAKGLAKQKSSS
jgi:capping protein alpha